MAWILAVCTFALLLVGGLVTTYRVGMAVPDWPTTFGSSMFAYPLERMLEDWGVTVEHSHRLLASVVGMLTVVMVLVCARIGGRWAVRFAGLGVAAEIAAVAVVLSQRDLSGPLPAILVLGLAACLALSLLRGEFKGLRALCVLTHFAVIGQGLLGGTRVLENSRELAFLHGAAAQLFYALVAALLVVTSGPWNRAEQRPSAEAGRLRRAALGALALVYAQIALGAWLRHTGRTDALILHVGLALAVVASVLVLAGRLRAASRADRPSGRERTPLSSVRRWLLVVLALQVLLGTVATVAILVLGAGFEGFVTLTEAVAATLHVAFGALLLAVCTAACLWSVRLVSSRREAAGDSANRVRATGLEGGLA